MLYTSNFFSFLRENLICFLGEMIQLTRSLTFHLNCMCYFYYSYIYGGLRHLFMWPVPPAVVLEVLPLPASVFIFFPRNPIFMLPRASGHIVGFRLRLLPGKGVIS